MGIFDNFLNVFKKSDNAAVNYTIDNLSSDLGVSRAEIERLMRNNGIAPINNTLNQTQVETIYDSYYRSLNNMDVKNKNISGTQKNADKAYALEDNQ